MTYLRLLRRIHRILAWLMARCDQDGKLWAELAWRDGHIAVWQLRYVERAQKISGFQPVKLQTRRPQPRWVVSQPTTTATTGANTTVTYTWPLS